MKIKKKHFKIMAGAVSGLIVLTALAFGLLYKFNPQLLWRIGEKIMPEVFADRLSGEPYNSLQFDGIDVSRHNGVIKWKQVAENRNIKFVYIKATEGSSRTDRRYRKNIEGAKAQGLLVGSYHFLTYKTPIRKQFENFKRYALKTEQDLIPVLDVEEAGIKGHWTKKQLQENVALFASLVKQHYGKLPVIYTNENFYKRYLSHTFDHHLLFIANYKRRPKLRNTKHNLWQYSEHGHVKGIGEYVDLIKLEKNTHLKHLKLH